MENIKAYVPLAAFLVLPFGFLSLGLIHIGHYYAFSILGLVIAGMMIRNVFVSLFLVYLAAWQVVLFLRAMGNPMMGMNAAASGYGQVIFFLIGAVVYISTAKSKLDEKVFFNVICIAAIIQCVIGVCQWFKFDPIVWFVAQFVPTKSTLPGHVSGSLGNSNFFAAFLAMSLPFFLRKGWKWFLVILGPVLFMSMTSSAVDPVFFGIYVFWLLSSDWSDPCKTLKRAGLGFIAALLCGVIYTFFIDENPFAGHNVNPRIGDYKDMTVQVITQPVSRLGSILFGLGPGAKWAQSYPVHSEWVTCFHHFGVVGVSLLIGYILAVGRAARHPALLASFVIIMLNFAGNSALHYAPTAFLICMIGGLLEREQNR